MDLPQSDNNTPDRDSLRKKIIKRELVKPGYKGKIHAFCCECIYDPYAEGTWLKQIENCTSRSCPLYSVRPLPTGVKHIQVDHG